MKVSLVIGNTHYNVDVAVANHIADLQQQVTMLSKVVRRFEDEEKGKRDIAKPAPQKAK